MDVSPNLSKHFTFKPIVKAPAEGKNYGQCDKNSRVVRELDEVFF